MPCLVCGRQITPGHTLCDNCYAPVGAPPVRPEIRTYGVRGVGLAASAAVLLAVLFYVVLSLWPIVGRSMARRALQTQDPDLLNQAALIEGIIGLPSVGVVIAAGVLVIVWFYRARKNLDAFPGADPAMSAGWAIGGWFVPFANFVVPFRIMANIARDSLWRLRTPALVGVWWAAWLVYWVADRLVARADVRAYGALPTELAGEADFHAYLDYYEAALGRSLPAMLASVVAGVALVMLIRQISAAQEARIARARATGPVMPGTTMAAPPVSDVGGGTIGA